MITVYFPRPLTIENVYNYLDHRGIYTYTLYNVNKTQWAVNYNPLTFS